MVGIQGVGGVPEPKPERPTDMRKTSAAKGEDKATSSDGVAISGEAKAAARIAGLINAAADQPDIRADKVEAAKAAIERGDFKDPDIVAKVADRINKIL